MSRLSVQHPELCLASPLITELCGRLGINRAFGSPLECWQTCRHSATLHTDTVKHGLVGEAAVHGRTWPRLTPCGLENQGESPSLPAGPQRRWGCLSWRSEMSFVGPYLQLGNQWLWHMSSHQEWGFKLQEPWGTLQLREAWGNDSAFYYHYYYYFY